MARGYKQSGLVTLVERRSAYLLSARLLRISTELIKAAGIDPSLKAHRRAVQTVTLDNGSEFVEHQAVAKAENAATYFVAPNATAAW